MKMRSLLHAVIPPPGRRILLRDCITLFIFLPVFAAVWTILEYTRSVLFTRPEALVFTAFFPWIWWVHLASCSGLNRVRAETALFIRLSLAGLCIMILAVPRTVRENKDYTVYYAVDISDSMGGATVDRALEFAVNTASRKPERDRAGLIVFGRSASVELPAQIVFPFEVIQSRIARDGTNLENALSLAAAVFPSETAGRIVLISDGTATDGNISRPVAELKSMKIPVDILPVEYSFTREVWLEKLDLPKKVKKGETYEISIVLSSLQPGRGELSLEENGTKIFGKHVDFEKGKNRYVLPLYLRKPGFYWYQAKIDVPPGEDGWRNNNRAVNFLYLKGEGKILLVADPADKPDKWEALLGIIRESGHAAEKIFPSEFPHDPFSLMPYDAVIFNDVASDEFDRIQMESIKKAVYNHGVGFIMTGGEDSFGPGGYHRTPVEEALPVDMDVVQKKVLPKGALAIILHTCEFAQGNTWGKRIAKEAIRVLSSRDEAGVLAYDYQGGEKWLFPLTPASEYQHLVTLINKAVIGDMPSFITTMNMALAALKKSDAAVKHVIIISDGDPSPPQPKLLKKFLQEKITISTVGINPHTKQDTAVLRSIASGTMGRFYFPRDPAILPSIFVKEAKTLRKSMIQNKVFVPRVENASPVLKGIRKLPQLGGYVLTTPKARSRVVLKGPEKEQIDPVLATWSFGIGKSAAFTSEFTPNWGREWLKWNKFRAFVEQLIKDISKVSKKTSLFLAAYAQGSRGTIIIEDHAKYSRLLDMKVKVAGPDDRSKEIEVEQTAPGRYEAYFPLWGRGRYSVMAFGETDKGKEQISGGFAVPYSPEYLKFRSSPAVLRRIAEETGGRILTGSEKPSDIFIENRKSRFTSMSAFDLFLIILACLIPLDVAVRRIHIDMYTIKSLFGRGGKAPVAEGTVGRLLKVKEKLSISSRSREEKRAQLRKKPLPEKPSGQKREPAPEKGTEETDRKQVDGEGLSTMERLLARKRKFQQDREQKSDDE